MFLLDGSGSITIENWYKVLNFTKTIVNSFPVGPDQFRIGVVSYSNRATVAFHLNTYDNKQDILDAIDVIPYKDQETNTSGALRTMYDIMFTKANGDRSTAQNVGFVVTDGASTRDKHLTIPEAKTAKDQGITIFAVGIGDEISPRELREMATKPSETHVFNATDFDDLLEIHNIVIDATCLSVAGKFH